MDRHFVVGRDTRVHIQSVYTINHTTQDNHLLIYLIKVIIVSDLHKMHPYGINGCFSSSSSSSPAQQQQQQNCMQNFLKTEPIYKVQQVFTVTDNPDNPEFCFTSWNWTFQQSCSWFPCWVRPDVYEHSWFNSTALLPLRMAWLWLQPTFH